MQLLHLGQGGGDKKDGFVQLKEKGRHHLQSHWEIYNLLFNNNIYFLFVLLFSSLHVRLVEAKIIMNVSIYNHIHLLIYEENSYI